MADNTAPVNTASKKNGSCLCNKVTIQVAKYNRHVVACHCQQCRKQTGHMVAAFNVLDTDLTIIGEENLQWYAASKDAKRGFCGTCGSMLIWKSNGSDNTSLMAGCMDSPTDLKLVGHIFTADKGDYYELEDGLPQHEGTGLI